MFRRFLLAASVALAMSTPVMAQNDPAVVMTGGKGGDYYLYFAPPIVKILDRAWVDATIQTSAGTPENMDYLLTHQKSYALGQGNVVADLLKDPKYAGKIRILPTNGLGNEVVIAIMNDKTFNRSQGSWALAAAHPTQVRFITASELSGPGRTMKELMALDPNHLGKATSVTYAPDMETAINAVADGTADVALMVQFPNPENPRFKQIATKKLHIVPVISESMKHLEIPGVGPAFTLCAGAKVAPDTAIQTACSPILVLTGQDNDNPDLNKVFAEVKPADFTPQEPAFAGFWRGVTQMSSSAWDSTVANTQTLVKTVGDKF